MAERTGLSHTSAVTSISDATPPAVLPRRPQTIL